MIDFDLNNFLADYKPKKMDLSCYQKCDKLKKYIYLNNQIDNLIPFKTYIKYIKYDDAFKNNKYDTHIKSGGILLAGGVYRDKFIKKMDNTKWTHLMLKYDPSKVINEDGNLVDGRLTNPIIFVIKIANNYVFYRKFENDQRIKFENLIIELIK